MATIGFIGLGNMGAPMAANLVKAGHKVAGYDINAAALRALEQAGGTAAGSAAEAARGAEFVITMLPAGEHVRDVWLHQGGLIEAVRGAKPLLIDCSTIDVDSARTVTAAAEKAGLDMLDAPVSGGTVGAANGTLTFMVGGNEAAFERGLPMLKAMGKNIFHRRRAGRRTGGEDLQQHDAGDQHGRRRRRAFCWRRSSAWTGASCTRSPARRPASPGRCRIRTARRRDPCRRRRPIAITRRGSWRR